MEIDKFTVVTAVHNQIEYSKLFWETLSKNSALPFRLIIIDNASTDNSGDFFKGVGAKVIRNEENLSYSVVQNQGLREADTEYIAFLNNDVYLSKDWDKKLISYMEKYGIEMLSPVGIENLESPEEIKKNFRRWKRINLIQRIRFKFDINFSKEHIRTLLEKMYGNWQTFTQKREERFKNFLYPGFAGNAIMIKRRLFEKIGEWNEEVAAADFDISLRTTMRAVNKHDTIVPMIAGDTYVHHFVSATVKKTDKAPIKWNNLKNVTEIYSKDDLKFLNRPKASVIIAVYDHADFLEKVFLSLLTQTEKDFEIVVADDGSGTEISDCILRYSDKFNHPIQHIWQENKGFRKTLIANRAAMSARSQYLIFIDGDMILHHKFVERHIKRAKVGHVQCGRRVMLNKKLSDTVSNEDIENRCLERMSFWKDNLDMREGKLKYGLFAPVLYPILRLIHPDYELIGCNFSIYKGDFISVNGYDENVVGRGLEDNNLGNRLKVAGKKLDYISMEAIAYHLYHNFKPILHDAETIKKFGNPDMFWTENGIFKESSQYK